MTDIVKQSAPTIWDAIQKSQKVLLHCHPSPDPDSVGSTLAIHHLLKSNGKQVTHIIGDSLIPNWLPALPGYEQIQPSKFSDINLSDYDTFIILDSSSPDQITKYGEVIFPPNLNTVIIDHHKTNQEFARINLVDPSYPAVGQILFDLFTLWGTAVTPDMAVCLYLAIHTDTGGFKYPLTTHETLFTAAKLAEINPNFPEAIFVLENSNDPQTLDYLGLALSLNKRYFSGKVSISFVPQAALQEKGIRFEHTEKTEVSNMLKSVIGSDIGISVVEKEPDVFKISFRTRDPQTYDVSKIALATGKGGGHQAAAGAMVYLPLEQAVQFLLQKIQETYPDLGQP